jgi:hypothetical protein
LRGSTTVFIDIENYSDSDVKLVLPKEIQSTFEKFIYSLLNGMKKLKLEYPNYGDFIDIFLNLAEKPDKFSEQAFLEKSGRILNDFNPDKEFKEALGLTFFNAIHIESNMLNLIIRPIMEYLESSTAKNAFLNSPFLFLAIPKGRGYFKGKIFYKNVIEREKLSLLERDAGTEFQIIIESEKECLIPIKEAILIQRIENEFI